jgi:hypothetical protein
MPILAERLQCVECAHVVDHFERGWRTYVTDEQFGPRELATYCPLCAAFEFDDEADEGTPGLECR